MERVINFSVHWCGLTSENFLPEIMIYKPFKTVTQKYVLSEKDSRSLFVNSIADRVKAELSSSKNQIENFWENLFNYSFIFVQRTNDLLGFNENKNIEAVFCDFEKNELDFHFFQIIGGASIHNNGYKFQVNSSELGHINTPHVHVEKAGVIVRYSLIDFEVIKKDRKGKEHKRDEKKIIIPTIKENRDYFLDLWEKANKGYKPPVLDENLNKYYPIS